ncbi:hypothetical protein JIN85_19110 [Luteolibacter pohnpeiensis]|uniref:Intracellular proteinase inhibitor BsuPI domain-containing protein n=1 Tax=Luteolibacter pohnpeiensis TaxID=454153 RepID=A0A934SAX8_9BACT|nr:hypothetical protein [Luteolibacter pohnpeiensis]MBK1884534.1 hypothetical protein [Luteolibacter pohnpeiensis]
MSYDVKAMIIFTRLLLIWMAFYLASPARADEPSNAVRGIAAEGKLPEKERYISVSKGETITLHLRNDTDGVVLFQALAGDCTSGKAILRSEQVLFDSKTKKGPIWLASWLRRAVVIHTEPIGPSIAYISKPGDEFDVAITLTALSNPKDMESPRIPLAEGIYQVQLDLYKLGQGMSGLVEPLLSYTIEVK